ncbi:Ig-like domain (group 4) [Agromyces sp. CF514]|uniref:LamG-like jellyroll fold domain-containing protein n=1 Tax=Agromyces sp. CF514 TaxID=1881031 RepID=UPI0008E20947|nr:LamG-like jellyroll fold domain-containing protein [Agromyces sp. CF514]SFR70301.1 Ig-like domain (group 4) [Agromyces sp. CF514]
MSKHAAVPRALRAVALALGAAVLVSATAAAPLAGALASAAPAAAATAAAPRTGLLAEYLFTQTTGSSVPNTAGGSSTVGAASVVNGTDALWTGSSLKFTGGAKTSTADWVRLPDGLLAGKQSATITVETKFDASMLTTFNFLWNIGSDSTTSYFFASMRDKARTAITTASNGGEANARAVDSLAADRWYSVTTVLDGAADTLAFYVDGAKVGQIATTLEPSSIATQTVNAIGRSPWPDPFYKGEVSTFRAYDRALTGAEVAAVSDADAGMHASTFATSAQAALDAIQPIALTDSSITLPTSSAARLSWSAPSAGLALGASGTTLQAVQPAPGSPAATGTVTATANVRGVTASKQIPVSVAPAAGSTDDYGYLMVHFIEDSAGYAEKIYLDVSRGDDPEQWDPLNDGKPILASQLGTTGIRDPYLTYNPETQTYYIIATDLRVFGGDGGSGSCTSWCYWTKSASTKLLVWESTDLVSWGSPRSIDVSLDASGAEVAELGMAWAPEATWVDDYYADGRGAFVLYWASNVYQNPEHSGSSYNRVLWGATTDFTQGTYAYGGPFVDPGANAIDTTMIQDGGTTYRITKDNGLGKGIYMESTTAARWWEPGTSWTQLQTKIGAAWAGGNAGGVEGPAVFKSHSEDRWYLYVDVIPSTGYRPMTTTDLDAGWTQLTDPGFFMAPSTKHGGVISLTKAQYDTVRAADASAAVSTDLGSVEVAQGSTAGALADALPATTAVKLAYDRGTATRPVTWDAASVDLTTPGTYAVTGVVSTFSANLDTWTGAGGSTAWNAPDRVLSSSRAVAVGASVVVTATQQGPEFTVQAETRCVAGKVALVTQIANTADAAAEITVATPYGSKTVHVAAGKTSSQTFSSRLASVPAGEVVATSVSGSKTATFAARACN